jgi:peptidoglycan/LPS O-acetylase OafA/YrhL
MIDLRLKELDILRFLAAISVVLFHYVAKYTIDEPLGSLSLDILSNVTQYGFLGVPLFFMISGFVILASTSYRSKYEFLIARFVRLFPVYWLCLSLTAVTLLLTENLDLVTYLVNLTLLQSFVGFGNIDGIYWTLGKELQFYFCTFLLLSLNILPKVKYWLSFWLLITVTFTLFNQPFFMGWIISPEYSSFFIAGVCFYLMKKDGNNAFYSSVLVISLLLSSWYVYGLSPGFVSTFTPDNQVISVIIVNVFYLLFWLLVTKRLRFSCGNKILVLGAITYPLYLIHNVIGKALLDIVHPYIGIELAIFSVVILMLLFSYIIYIYYDKRISMPLKANLIDRLGQLKLKFSS